VLSSLPAYEGHWRRRSLDVGCKYRHISDANLRNVNHGMDSLTLFVGVAFFHEGGRQRALLPRGAPTFVSVELLEVVLPKVGSTSRSPAGMRTMTALRQFGRTSPYHEAITSITYQQRHRHETCAPIGIGTAGQRVSRIKPMFRAEIQWLASARP
jgi:hypothetical protein